MYKTHRERLDELVFRWVRYKGQLGPDEYLELQRSAKALESELKLRIKKYPAADYVKAKNVLESLTYEVVRQEAANSMIPADEPARSVAAR